MSTENKKLRYILSAGRTGTVFLEKLINRQFGEGTAEHEPTATRYQMMIANLRNDWGIGNSLLQRSFHKHREKRVAEAGGLYVEINPFLCAMTDLLALPDKELHVVHLVREPGDWASSISNFKASTTFRDIIDYIPFSKPYPSPRPTGWSTMTDLEHALWRWHWCNSRIESLSSSCAVYGRIRYEDLFSDNSARVEKSISEISSVLDLPQPITLEPKDLALRANPSKGDLQKPNETLVGRICGSLASRYGY